MRKKLTTDQFIERARTIHGDRYDYSMVEYIKAKTKVNIQCGLHGCFTQTPNGHLNGNGCPNCAGVVTLTTDKFIEKAKYIHGGRYDYSKTKCVSYLEKLTIICSEHGEFYQNYENHLKGHGCRKCGAKLMKIAQRKTKEQFIKDSNLKHDGKYSYSLVNYINNNTKVIIICKSHGPFSQSPATHMCGSGCPQCSSTVFDTSRKSKLYILVGKDKPLMKIGVTGRFSRRLTELKCSTPFDFNTVELFDVDGNVAKIIEKALHGVSRNAGLNGFNGSTEWFEYDSNVISLARIIFFTRSL